MSVLGVLREEQLFESSAFIALDLHTERVYDLFIVPFSVHIAG
jgi:hypothetical protein